MTITKLCSELAKREKTKSQARIQAIRSLIGHLSDIVFKENVEFGDLKEPTIDALLTNGERRAKKGKRK